MADVMLSTADNPYNPFNEWDEWQQYDYIHRYYTSAYLARIVRSSDELSEADQSVAIDDAIQEIIAENPGGFYIAVSSEQKVSESE